ncbi:MAG: FAD-dependent oxidoreductase, partial [Victivallales bacterium]|nr:FAD-dependent oxidoreductase [Victivallales bacterium]
MKVVVIGGVAAGPKAASRIIRLCPDAEVTILEKDEFLSYAGCGLPYYISGTVKEQKELMATPVGVLRDPVFFQNVKNVKVLNHTTARQIDRRNKKVAAVAQDGSEIVLPYD